MNLKVSVTLLMVCWAAGSVRAQTTASDAGSGADWHRYLPIVKSIYGLSDAQIGQLESKMKGQQALHDEYVERNDLTLRRVIKAVRDVLPKDHDIDDVERVRIAKKMQSQIYQIHAKDPLSFTNVIKTAEGMLSPDAVKKGRANLASRYKEKVGNQEPDYTNLDQLVIEPIPFLFQDPATLSNSAPPAVNPVKQNDVPAKIDSMALPPDDSQRMATTSTPPPPKPPVTPPPQKPVEEKPADPAPPLSQWATSAQLGAANYGFSGEQKTQVEAILQSVQSRANAYNLENKAAYEQAQGISDSSARAKKLEELNAPLNKLYAEMNRRIRNIATMEQQQAADKAAGVTTAKPDASAKK